MLEIPLNSVPEQYFKLSTPSGTHELRVVANSRLEKWTMSIYSIAEGARTPLITGIALMGGVNIIAQYPSLPWTNLYVINTGANEDPTLTDLGTLNRLILLEEADVAAIS